MIYTLHWKQLQNIENLYHWQRAIIKRFVTEFKTIGVKTAPVSQGATSKSYQLRVAVAQQNVDKETSAWTYAVLYNEFENPGLVALIFHRPAHVYYHRYRDNWLRYWDESRHSL